MISTVELRGYIQIVIMGNQLFMSRVRALMCVGERLLQRKLENSVNIGQPFMRNRDYFVSRIA
jgi:hypothetical protein